MNPPLAMRVGVLAQLLLLLIAVGFLLPTVSGPRPWIDWVPLVLQGALLPGIWGMRRWAVLAYAGVAVLSLFAVFSMTRHAPLWSVAAAFALTRGLILVPAVVYWRRMS